MKNANQISHSFYEGCSLSQKKLLPFFEKTDCPFPRKIIALFQKTAPLRKLSAPLYQQSMLRLLNLCTPFPSRKQKLPTFLNLLSQFPYPTYVSGTPCIPLETSYLTAVIVVLSSAFSYAIYGPVLLLCVEIVPSFHRI